MAIGIRSSDNACAVVLFLIVFCMNFSWCHGGDTKISCLERERISLVEFKLSVVDTSNKFSSWVGEDCCNWVGVGCNNRTGRVVKLDLRNGHGTPLAGKNVSLSLTHLRNLEYLDLSSNNFNGSNIPTFFGTFKALRYLNLSNSSFAGVIPTSFATQILTQVDLSLNQLRGSIPTSLSTSSTLTSINFSSNQLSGPIPLFIGTLLNLTYLNLNHNHLNGTIPESFGKLSNLVELSLRNNSFTGTVSETHFDKLSSLKVLDMSLNRLVFNLSSNWLPPFQIQDINLRSCQLGPRFPLWLQTQNEIENIYISNANISGFVPNWFWNRNTTLGFQYSRVDLSHNQIQASFPVLTNTKMDMLDLSHNIITGPLPENIHVMLPNLSALLLCGNFITGSIPTSLCKLQKLEILDISNNRLTGNLPEDCWNGSKDIQVINLSHNNLTGFIPTSIGRFLFIRSLNLNNNHFSGELPMTLQNANYLNFLDLAGNGFSGNIPPWIGKVSSLQILNLRSNKFGGTLTHEICLLNNLRILDLADNNFSGIVPACARNLSGMIVGGEMDVFSMHGYGGKLMQIIKGREYEYNKTLKYLVNLDLSSNILVGEIPEELTLLVRLGGLNLSNNHFTGDIPKNIGSLKSLQSLDFSHNQLSGAIPDSMSDLGLVGYLNLSFNSLSGRIPFGHPQTFDSSSYMGNSELCGIPLDRKCSPETPPQDGGVVQEKEKEKNMLLDRDGFYIGMGVGTVVGFWGVWGVLLSNKTWRYAYFDFLENMRDHLALAAFWIRKQFKGN